MKTRYKVIYSILACALICGLSFAISYAYLISNDTAENDFTVGETIIEITEEYYPPEELNPGVEFTKKPSVTNTGNLSCYVRMRADFSDSRAEAFCEPLDIDTENWEYDDTDGYYYYKRLLEPNEITEPLFTTVKVKESTSPLNIISFDIVVYAEAVQHTDHDNACATNEYRTVWSEYISD